MDVIAFVFDDVAFARVAVVDALSSRRRRHLRHHPAAGQAGFPVSRRDAVPSFVLRLLRAPPLHVALLSRARAGPADARDAACGERAERAAGAQGGELPPARAGGRVGRAIGGGGALTEREERGRAAGGRRALSVGRPRERDGERDRDGESPLIGCRRRRRRLRSRVLVGTADGSSCRRPAAVVLLPLPVLLQQIRPRLPRAAALQLLPPRPTVAVAILLCAPLYSPSAAASVERRATAAILVFGEANVNNFDNVGEKARNRRISFLVISFASNM